MLGDAVSSGYDCISRRFSAGLLAVNQGKPTQKCSQRRQKCASGILETRPKCSLLRGAWIDYQKTPSFATNLRLRFISISQPVVAPALEGISPGFTQENMEGDHAVNGELYLSPYSKEHTGTVPRVRPSLQHTGDDPSGSSFPYTKQAEPVGSTLWWSGQDSYLWSRKATNPLGLSVRLRRTAAADLKDQARQLLLGQLRNGRLAALSLATLPCSVRLRLAVSRTAGARQGDKPFGFVGSALPNCRRLI